MLEMEVHFIYLSTYSIMIKCSTFYFCIFATLFLKAKTNSNKKTETKISKCLKKELDNFTQFNCKRQYKHNLDAKITMKQQIYKQFGSIKQKQEKKKKVIARPII